MGTRTSYEPGTFCWTDLTTPDQAGAKAFYSSLFGWEAHDMPMGDDGFYSMMLLDGRRVAAIAPQPPQQRDAGVPPVWNNYVSVDSADDTLARAVELGGSMHAPAFDVFEAGRMGVIQDPQGAYVMAWQPRENFGAELVNVPGALVWNELNTPDVDAASAFYSDLFGWQISPFEASAEPYLSISNAGAFNGGIRTLSSPGAPPHWMAYFGAQDIDVALARVSELGGSAMAGPIDIQIAKIAFAHDPQGGAFALYAGQLED